MATAGEPLPSARVRTVYDHIRTRTIVLHRGAMLLLPPEAGGGAWLPPGGGLEPGESLAEGAAREVLEETGIRVRVGPVAFLEEWVSAPDQAPGADYNLHVFLYAEPTGAIDPRPERPHLPTPRWVPLAEVPDLLLHPAELKWLAGALRRGESPPTGARTRGRFEPPSAPPRPIG